MGSEAPAADAEFPAWARSVEDCESRLGVSAARGLSSSDAAARLRTHGPNELAEHPGPTLLQLLLQQFEDTLVRILLAAAAVSFLLALSSSSGELTTLSAFVEPLVIFLILVVNAAVGIWQETNAEKALHALREIQSDHVAFRLQRACAASDRLDLLGASTPSELEPPSPGRERHASPRRGRRRIRSRRENTDGRGLRPPLPSFRTSMRRRLETLQFLPSA